MVTVNYFEAKQFDDVLPAQLFYAQLQGNMPFYGLKVWKNLGQDRVEDKILCLTPLKNFSISCPYLLDPSILCACPVLVISNAYITPETELNKDLSRQAYWPSGGEIIFSAKGSYLCINGTNLDDRQYMNLETGQLVYNLDTSSSIRISSWKVDIKDQLGKELFEFLNKEKLDKNL